MADSFKPDSFQPDSFQPDSFVPEEKKKVAAPVKPFQFQEALPAPTIALPRPGAPAQLFTSPRGAAYDRPASVELQLVRDTGDGTTVFQPSDIDTFAESIANFVIPDDRDKVRQVLQRDVRSREDLNLLQGKFKEFGEKHGFPFTAGLVEDFLNPMSIPEFELLGFGKGVLSQAADRAAAKGLLNESALQALKEQVEKDIPSNPFDFAFKKEIEKRKALISQELYLPDEIADFTPNDPMGVLKKRLALPGEENAELIIGDRITQNDPMGVMQGKFYRVVPVTQQIPDHLVKDVTPEGIRAIALNQEATAEYATQVLGFKYPKPAPGEVFGSETAAKKLTDNVRTNVMETGEDMGIYADAQRAIQVETRSFGDPEKVVQEMNSMPLNEKGRFWRKFQTVYNSAKDMVGQVGGGIGKNIASRFDEATTVADVRWGRAIRSLNGVLKGVADDPVLSENLVAVLEGGAEPMNAAVKKAALVTRGIFDRIAVEANEVGLKLRSSGDGLKIDFMGRKNYWPRFYDVEKLAKDGSELREMALKKLMDSNGYTRQEAVDFIDRFAKESLNRYGHLEISRVADMPGYSKDVNGVLNNYLQGAFHRIELARQFGPNNELVGRLVAGIKDNYEKTIADAAIQVMTGKTSSGAATDVYRETQSGILSAVGKMMMPLSAIMNAPQGVTGAYTRTNFGALSKSFVKAFEGASKQEVQEAGIVLDRVWDLFGKFASNSEYFKRNGFAATEAFNRTLMGLSSKQYLEGTLTKLIAKEPESEFLKRELTNLGLDAAKVIERGKFSEDEISKAMVRMVHLTQGRFSPANMPIWASTPLGKIAAHLRGFDVLWASYVKDYIVSEARQGNFAPAMKLIAGSGLLVGEVEADIWSAINGKDRPENPLARVVENIMFAGSLGYMTDIVGGFATGKKDAASRLLSNPEAQMVTDAYSSAVDLSRLKFSSTAKLLGRRALTPAAVYTMGKINPWLGVAAGAVTRRATGKVVKNLQESEQE